MTGGILPETLFRQYLDILRDNRGEKYNRKSIKTAGRKCPAVLDFRSAHGFDSIVFRPQNAGGFCRCKIQRGAGKTGDNAACEGDNAACNEGNVAREGDKAACDGDTPLVTGASRLWRGQHRLWRG